MEYLVGIFSEDSFALQIFITIFATLLSVYITGKITKFFVKKAKKTANIWDDAVSYAMDRPIKILIILLGISHIIKILDADLQIPIFSAIDNLHNLFIVFALLIFSLRFLKKLELRYIDIHNENQEKIHTINIITKLLRTSVFITTILILMQNLGVNISGVLAFGGVSGIAVGFAAKDLLSNFFGAIMIYMDKPFKVGDWVRSPDKEIEGVVSAIGWRQTKIMTFRRRPIYVPNSTFSVITVENPSRMTHRRVYENIGIRYRDVHEVDNIVNKIRAYLLESDKVDNKQVVIVNLNKFAESSLEIIVYCYLYEVNWVKYHQVKQEVLMDVTKIIHESNANIAYPTLTINKINKIG
jgi:MscS family membrane protein